MDSVRENIKQTGICSFDPKTLFSRSFAEKRDREEACQRES